MRTIAAIVVLTYIGGVPVLAQQPAAGGQAPIKSYNITDLTPTEVGVIGKGLSKLPYEEVAVLLNKLQQQITAQDNPPKPAESGPPPAVGGKGKR